LLVKVSCSGSTYEVARRKMLRALVEFRIRGVKVSFSPPLHLNPFTNIPFALFHRPTFLSFSDFSPTTSSSLDRPGPPFVSLPSLPPPQLLFSLLLTIFSSL